MVVYQVRYNDGEGTIVLWFRNKEEALRRKAELLKLLADDKAELAANFAENEDYNYQRYFRWARAVDDGIEIMKTVAPSEKADFVAWLNQRFYSDYDCPCFGDERV